MPRSLVVFALLVLAACAAAEEIQISQPKIVPGRTIVRDPVVAAGDGFLVAWRVDPHSSRVPNPVMVRIFDGVAWRKPIPTVLGDGRSVQAVWNATSSEWLVVRTLPGYYFTSQAVVATRVSADGAKSADLTLASPRSGSSSRVIAISRHGPGTAILAEYDGAFHLLGVNSDGSLSFDQVLDFEPAALAPDARGDLFVLRRQDGDALASTPDYERFAVIKNTSAGLWGALFNGARERLETFLIAPEGGDARSIAWDGRTFVTAYVDRGRLCTARFTGAADVKTECSSEPAAQPFLDAGRHGTFRAWISDFTIQTDAGFALSEFTRARGPVTAVVDEAGVLAAWTEEGDDQRIVLGGVNNDRTLRPEKTFFTDAPMLARSGSQTLLVWREDGRVIATRVDANGDAVPPRVDLGHGFVDVAVAARDGGWLVAWDAGDEIVATRVTASLDSTGLEHFGSAGTAQDTPAAAPTGDGFLVAWSEVEGSEARIVVEPLNTNGQRVSGGIRIAESEHAVYETSIACGPEACLVAWGGANVYGVLVGHDGTPHSEPRLLMSRAATVFPSQVFVRALSDGSYRVYHGQQIVSVTAAGDGSPPQDWSELGGDFANVVVWGGRTTLIYIRPVVEMEGAETTQVFAFVIPPRQRSVRH